MGFGGAFEFLSKKGKFKRDVKRGQKQLATHQAVVEGIQQAVTKWVEPLTLADEQTDCPITLMGRPGGISCEAPLSPDAWMMDDGRKIRRPFSAQLVSFPSIQAVLDKFRTCRRQKPYEELRQGNIRFLVMQAAQFHRFLLK